MSKPMGATATALTIVICAAAYAAPQIAREDLGRSVKLTVVVDKVMQPEAGWTTEEWMVKEAADAGFNVYSPRRGYDDLDAVREVTDNLKLRLSKYSRQKFLTTTAKDV